MHSSQNEQDSRNYARFAKVPMLDPADSQEAYDFVRAGFELSEQFDTPVMLRTTTRISHAKGVVVQKERIAPVVGEWAKDVPKYVMLPNRKVIPFSDFFTASLSVMDVIKELIAKEDAPKTDQEIADELGKRGIVLARRTVAKYREQLNILPSSLR